MTEEAIQMHRVYFNGNEAADGSGEVYGLWLPASQEDLEKIADEIHEGMHVIIYWDEDVEAEAVLHFDQYFSAWTAKIVPGTIKYHV